MEDSSICPKFGSKELLSWYKSIPCLAKKLWELCCMDLNQVGCKPSFGVKCMASLNKLPLICLCMINLLLQSRH